LKRIFITGIDTNVGKTIVSAIVAEALGADYWKPVQAGALADTDSMLVKKLVSNPRTKIHKENFLLTKAMSPHAAAALDHKRITLSSLKPPATQNTLIIEGAGGIMVPLSTNQLVIDHVKKLKCSVLLVSKNYLGSINHSLLTLEALKKRRIKVFGIVFIGKPNAASQKIIAQYGKAAVLGFVKPEKTINKKTIKKYAKLFKPVLKRIGF